MGSKAVRDAMVKASAGNLRTFVWLDEGKGKYWTSAPVPDVKNVLKELARLQDVETRILEKIDELETQRGLALGFAMDLRSEGDTQRAIDWKYKAQACLDEMNLLKGFLEDWENGE